MDPVTGRPTEDQDRILNIFREHHAAKCTDPQIDPTEAAASDPPLTSEFLEVIADRYSYSVDEHFPAMPLDIEYPMYDSLVITKEELHKLIKDLKNRTAPGRSGLDKTVLLWFTRYFPETLTEYFGDLIRNPKWELDPDTDYLKVRKIIFLAKKNKDPSEVGNYRPISLLETTYKIISKFLIEKISSGVYQTVSKDQFGFIPTRVMSNCSLTLISIINTLKSRYPGSFLFFADISAALTAQSSKLSIPSYPNCTPTPQSPFRSPCWTGGAGGWSRSMGASVRPLN